jgi:hypothetical protein
MVERTVISPHDGMAFTKVDHVWRGQRAMMRDLAQDQSAQNDRVSFRDIVVIPTKRHGGLILKRMSDVSPIGRRERGAHATAAAN